MVSSTSAAFKPFHEFAFVFQDDVNLQYAGGTAVPNLEIDDDPENSGQKAVNYRTEPLWYRGGWGPETPLTGNGPGFRTRQFTQFDQILHNSWIAAAIPRLRCSRRTPARSFACASCIRPATPSRTSSSCTATPGYEMPYVAELDPDRPQRKLAVDRHPGRPSARATTSTP